jgi:4-hydroxy-3-methylbut-2-enyl diphosphate reductase
MDLDDLSFAQAAIRSIFPSARFEARRCLATERRQNALTTAPQDIDLYVILGSGRSNNTAKLEALARKNYPHASVVRALDLAEIKVCNLNGKKKAALASGASTSPQAFNEVLTYLKSL